MPITVRAELRGEPDTRAEFVTVARLLAEAAASEDGTLRYDWYESEDPMELVVIEEYVDADAATAHNQNCQALLQRVAELAAMTSLHLHGRLGPELEGWVAAHPFAHAHPPLRQD
jgi:quinol monooxygenase YgiN